MNPPKLNAKLFLIISWLTLYLMGTDLFVMSPLLPLIARHFRVTDAGAGWGMTTFAIAYAALAPVFGHFGDRRGRLLPLIGGLIVFGLANAATALLPGFPAFLIARFVAGGAAAAITPTVYALTTDLSPVERRGAWLSFVGSGIFAALWSSAPLGSLLGFHFGWTWVFVILGVVPFPIAAVNFFLLPRRAAVLTASAPSGYGRLLVDVSATCLWAIALYSSYVYLGAGLLSSAGCTSSQVAVAVTVFGVGMVSGVLGGGHLADPWGPRQVALTAYTGLAFTALAVRQSLGHFHVMLVALLFFAFSAGLYFSSFQVYLAHHHHNRRGTALAWNNSALYLGITLGSILGGIVLTNHGFGANLVLSACVALLGSAWTLYVQRES